MLALAVAACAPVQPSRVVDGVSYPQMSTPYRGRWWHLYERGVSWAEGRCWTEAEADLRACLALRQEDDRRARTYGLHFVHCFPHRELGCVLIAQRRFDEAERELRLSLEQEPSAKAQALLERIAELRRGGAAGAGVPAPPARPGDARAAAADPVVAAPAASAPTVGLPPPGPVAPLAEVDAVVRSAAGGLVVSGRVPGDHATLHRADGADRQPVVIDGDGRFRAALPAGSRLVLDTGDGEHDLAGADHPAMIAPAAPAAPVCVLDGPADGDSRSGGRCLYGYRAAADAGLAELTISDTNGRQCFRVALSGQWALGIAEFSLEPGEHHLRFCVVDRRGNRTAEQRTLTMRALPVLPRGLRASAVVLPVLPAWPGAHRTGDDAALVAAIVADGRFVTIDREAKALNTAELLKVDAGYVDRATAAQVGRLLHSRYVVAGQIWRRRHDVECYLRLVHCDSGRVVAEADAYAEIAEGDAQERFFSQVAGRLRQAFPVVTARLGMHRDRVVLEAGSADGVRSTMRFHLFPGDAVPGSSPLETVTAEPIDEQRSRLIPLTIGRLVVEKRIEAVSE